MRQRAINMMFSFAMMFAMLFPSLHAAHHLVSHFHSEHCKHRYAAQAELNHSHSVEDCFSCDFVFSTALHTEVYEIALHQRIGFLKLHDQLPACQFQTFGGCHLLLRGPPAVG